MLVDLEQEARTFVDAGAQRVDTETRLTVFMRYTGQGWEIPVSVPHKAFDANASANLFKSFEKAYRTLFGRTIDGLAVEITNWALTVSTVLPEVEAVERHNTGSPADKIRTRQFFDAALRSVVVAKEIDRDQLQPGQSVEGPAVVVEDETTTIVTSAYRLIAQGDGSLRLVRKEGAA